MTTMNGHTKFAKETAHWKQSVQRHRGLCSMTRNKGSEVYESFFFCRLASFYGLKQCLLIARRTLHILKTSLTCLACNSILALQTSPLLAHFNSVLWLQGFARLQFIASKTTSWKSRENTGYLIVRFVIQKPHSYFTFEMELRWRSFNSSEQNTSSKQGTIS